jgi:hypothetical protein
MVKAVFWAIPPILLLVVLPRIIVSHIPATLVKDASSVVGLNMPLIVTNLTIFGIVLAALSALQTWAYDWSLLKPVASSLHMSTTYVLLLFFFGWGDPWTFGTANIPLSLRSLGTPSGFGVVNIAFISTFIALLFGVALALKVVQRGMKYSEARRFHEKEMAQEAQAVAAAPSPHLCQKCGAAVQEGQKYCMNCGSPIQAPASPPEQV